MNLTDLLKELENDKENIENTLKELKSLLFSKKYTDIASKDSHKGAKLSR